MEQEPDIFDRMAAQGASAQAEQSLSKEELPALVESGIAAQSSSRTPPNVRQALQFLLAHGWLESATKPKLFSLIAAQPTLLDTLLEPLNLRVVVERRTPEISARGELDLGEQARVYPSDAALQRLKELMPDAQATVVYGEG